MCKSSQAAALAFLFFIITLNSCSKTGAKGATGANGTANVMYSSWANLTMTYNSSDSAYEQSVTVDSLTQAVIDSGLVLCYIKYTNSSGKTQIESASNYISVVLGLKTISLYSYYYDFTGVPFRYIIIHGGTAIGSRLSGASRLLQGHTKEEWNTMTYDQVISLLNQ
ncbi:MAG: hypothetical protein ABJB86_09610 [Bacteroidota bacterium]